MSTLAVPAQPEPEQPPKAEEKSTYGQILKSTALIGGSQVVNIAMGIIRTKTMAMFLGPAGFGLFGLYSSIADVTQSLAGMGINNSGVRQIAEAVGSGDEERIARTVAVLRRTSVALGLLGAVLLILCSQQVSVLTFGSRERATAVSLLSLAVLFRSVSAGQAALIQGTRRIADFAKINALGALFGTLISIPVVYFFREKGVVPSLVGVAAMTILTSWWYSRKIRVSAAFVTPSQVRQEASALLKLGFAFMASGVMMMMSAYVVRIIILHKIGFEATGLYQSAWTLGGLYVGFILQAMGADFYPRLTGSVSDNAACTRMVNEQARVGLLLAGPGLIATLTFAPIVIALFYSAEFGQAVDILRWICVGVALRVITWPMGFIIVAKGAQQLFFWSELAWTIMNIGLTWICVNFFGLKGAGIAFFGSYMFHGLLIYSLVSSLTGFRWSLANLRTGLLSLSFIALVFSGFYVLPFLIAVSVGVLVLIISCAYSVRALLAAVSLGQVPRSFQRWLAQCRLLPSETVNCA